MRRHPALILTNAVGFGRLQAVRLTALLTRVAGQGLVEYGLILVLIMVVCVGILTMVGSTVSQVWYTKLIGRF